jgi:hypothetical protein
VGVIGFITSMVFWSSWGGFHRAVYSEGVAPRRRRRIIDEEID